ANLIIISNEQKGISYPKDENEIKSFLLDENVKNNMHRGPLGDTELCALGSSGALVCHGSKGQWRVSVVGKPFD
ncbi:MAG: hypothetical protein Q8807_03785, partial ['Waltheria sp.' little leaf phytoplasma]|nr:hypothetical protein ['Waltheria sp.' little leaf phytoplasma]